MNTSNIKSKTKFSWPKTASVNQNFSFPDTIIYYVLMNPSSSNVYLKMVKCCKYFFEKNPILVVGHLDWLENGVILCEKKDCRSSDVLNPCCVEVDLNKVKGKIWLTKKFSLWSSENIPNFISTLRFKLFRCEITELSMSKQIILYDDFKFMVAPVECINLHEVKMVNDDGNPAMLEAILEALPNVRIFEFTFAANFCNATVSTFKNINKLKNLCRLKLFNLYEATEILNVKDLSTFIANHKDTRFLLDFNENISEAYKNQLDALIDSIIESAIPNRLINYPDQDAEKLKILFERLQEDDDLNVY